MDANLESISQETPQSTVLGHMNDTLDVGHSDLPAACAMCQRILSSDSETGDLEAIGICGDCRFLFLEDRGTPIHDVRRRRTPRVRRTRYSSSESIENLFSQQFSNIINLARQNQPTVSGHENQSLDSDAAARLVQRTSSRITPSGSRRWRRVLSDTESDGLDSLYGESESNVSFNGYRLFHGESDTISFSAYGGDSDASVDAHSLLDNEIFTHPDAGSDLDSDTDIDPMHTGLNQWNSDDQEEEEEDEEEEEGEEDDDDNEEEDNEWEEADEENTINSLGAVVQLRRSLNLNEINVTGNRISLGIRGRREAYISDIFLNLEEQELQAYAGNSGDYLDARGFEELLEQLAETTDSSRRGAPPTALSFVNSLPCVVIREEHEKKDSLACAICKEFLSLGTIVNQLPCSHLYHPSCILPWLSARNSCPLCRYELPTDDKDYEASRQSRNNEFEIREIQQQGRNEDSSSDITDGVEADEACEFGRGRREEGGRGRWFYLAAAAPIVSLVGIVIVLWLGNPLTVERRRPIGHLEFRVQGQHPNRSSGSFLPNQRENRSRRWWSLV